MVADGYKDTEIGVIPIEWDVVELDDIIEFKNGKGHEKSIDENGQYIVVNSKFIASSGNVYKSSNSNLSPLKENDIVLVMSDIPNGRALSKCFYINEDNRYTLNQRICSLTAIEDNPLFLFYRLNRNRYFLKFNDGVNQTNLRKNEVLECKIPLPPLKEQEKIADILSTADDKIDTIASQIQKAEILKQGLLQKLLSEGIGHSEFKDSELGKIPESWEVVELKSIIKDLVGGVSVNSEDRRKLKEEYGILKTSAIQNGSFFPDKHKTILNTEINRATTNPLADHIIFSRMNTPDLVGHSGYVEQTIKDLFLPDRLWQLDVKDRDIVFVKWLSFIIVSSDTFNMIKKSATGTSNSMKNISKPSLLKIKISLPPLEEQKQIADILSTADEKLEVLRAKKEKYETLKKGLLQKLLSGEVRV